MSEERTCTWTNDDEYDDRCYETECGQSLELTEGTLAENGMRFCCYCGARLVEALAAESGGEER